MLETYMLHKAKLLDNLKVCSMA